MLDFFDFKTSTAILAMLVGTIAGIPYLWQIFKRRTKPHAYTWLIWSLTQGIAAAGVWYGGGGITAIGWLVSMALAFVIFLLSFKYGTRNITRGDTVVLIGAIAAIFVWQGLDNPLLAVFMATIIDFLGYLPTYRKTFEEPWSEDLIAWAGYVVAPSLSFLSLLEYNLLTSTYVAMTVLANLAMVVIIATRRPKVAKPKDV